MLRLALATLAMAANVHAGPLLLSAAGSFEFDDFQGAGFSAKPAAGQLDSDRWRVTGASQGDGAFGGTFASGDFARGASAGSVAGGGVYAFDVGNGSGSPDWAVGFQPTGSDFTPGALELRLTNDGPATVDAVWVDYEVHTHNNGDRSTAIGLFYAAESSSGPANAPRWVDAEYTATTGPGDGQLLWVATSHSVLLDGLDLLPGTDLLIGWSFDDESGSGSRDEIAFDDIAVRVASVAVTAVDEPPVLGLILVACAWLTRTARRCPVA